MHSSQRESHHRQLEKDGQCHRSFSFPTEIFTYPRWNRNIHLFHTFYSLSHNWCPSMNNRVDKRNTYPGHFHTLHNLLYNEYIFEVCDLEDNRCFSPPRSNDWLTGEVSLWTRIFASHSIRNQETSFTTDTTGFTTITTRSTFAMAWKANCRPIRSISSFGTDSNTTAKIGSYRWKSAPSCRRVTVAYNWFWPPNGKR